jgi:hypothetical protein
MRLGLAQVLNSGVESAFGHLVGWCMKGVLDILRIQRFEVGKSQLVQ